MAQNIVLLSDGTGQRGGVGFTTNVWQLYEALLRNDHQRVCYDDGVGSEKMMVSRVLGGAVGLGLARNVRHLYSFLVRTWESGDRIFLFGFSRGAFTVRLLAGLIAECGIIDLKKATSDKELDEMVRAAYCAFRSSQFFPGVARTFKETYGVIDSTSGTADIPIKFVGVWDTVDAVGVPIDEMREAFDQILRYSFRDNLLGPLVEVGRHAVAIDEARRTFAPVMWDERLETKDRIRQVWFSGVHSNVGGGYPKRQMAMIPLNWMIEEAIPHGLLIDDAKRDEYRHAADVYGRLYDSRTGLAAYYRYKPRYIDILGPEYTSGDVRIHHTVFARISEAFDDYSPHNLPNRCEVAGRQGGNISLPDETSRCMDLAKGVVWWRRFLLGVLWTITLVILVAPWLTYEESAPELINSATNQILSVAEWNLPDAAKIWTDALRAHPVLTLIAVSLILLLLYLRKRIGDSVIELANAGWYRLYPSHRTPSNKAPMKIGKMEPIRLAHYVRKIRFLSESSRLLGGVVIGLMSFVLFVPLKFGQWVHRNWCLRGKRFREIRAAESPAELALNAHQSLIFLPKDYKRLTGIKVIAGEVYRIQVEDFAGWYDGEYPASPNGLDASEPADRLDMISKPFKRHPSVRLMTLMARVQYPCLFWCRIASTTEAIGIEGTLIPKKDGELTLYVNDAMLVNIPILRGILFGIRELFYGNNRGIASIRITHLPR